MCKEEMISLEQDGRSCLVPMTLEEIEAMNRMLEEDSAKWSGRDLDLLEEVRNLHLNPRYEAMRKRLEEGYKESMRRLDITIERAPND